MLRQVSLSMIWNITKATATIQTDNVCVFQHKFVLHKSVLTATPLKHYRAKLNTERKRRLSFRLICILIYSCCFNNNNVLSTRRFCQPSRLLSRDQLWCFLQSPADGDRWQTASSLWRMRRTHAHVHTDDPLSAYEWQMSVIFIFWTHALMDIQECADLVL